MFCRYALEFFSCWFSGAIWVRMRQLQEFLINLNIPCAENGPGNEIKHLCPHYSTTLGSGFRISSLPCSWIGPAVIGQRTWTLLTLFVRCDRLIRMYLFMGHTSREYPVPSAVPALLGLGSKLFLWELSP